MKLIQVGDRVTIGKGKTVWRVVGMDHGRLVLHNSNGSVRWLSVTASEVSPV